ncbi:MAG: sulfatase-like hydrolase/transferase [Candidatus Hydrogenedentes bacterium]|nr:sulfatase-like hydrolase/transferase [Candidatus Hydrogenedentota bacterium]
MTPANQAEFTRRTFLQGTAAGAFATTATAAKPTTSTNKEAKPAPNIIWIWADNLAYADLSCYGSNSINTPHLDSLAEEGARFTQYYIAHAVCSPSRAALITGRQPFRAGIVDVLRPDSPCGLPADEITLGHALKARGYATCAIGKWHLGDRKEFLPCQRGFDYYYGQPYSMDMLPTVVYRNNEIARELPGDSVQRITEEYTDEAIHFIDQHSDGPFLVYLSHTIPHPPLNIPIEARTPGRSMYEDSVEYLDREVGRLLDALDARGLKENTVVFFSSDNGPMLDEGNTGGLRGGIRDSYEGGLRVPLIARWPGRIPAGHVVERPAIAYDIFPTLLDMAGGDVPADRTYDGQNIMALLTDSGSIERNRPFFWVYFDNVTAMRDGDWKLHVGHREQPLATPELYNLAKDPHEERICNEGFPEVLEELLEKVRVFQAEVPYVWSLKYPVRDPEKRASGVRRE